MNIKIKLFENCYLPPQRKHYNDAGADVYAAKDILVRPHSTVKIPLGFGVYLPDGYMGVVHSRSGLSSTGLSCENAPIDSGYTGEVHAIFTNITDERYQVKRGDRVGQLVITPILIPNFVEELGENRGDCGFGSTGK